jgi:hypothetical protein
MSLREDRQNVITVPPAQHLGIRELAEHQLRANSHLALRSLSCETHEGVLFLRGSLPTYYLKQLAQTLVADVPGVRAIVNEIDVVPANQQGIGPAAGHVSLHLIP